jgi:hypothetical protein
MTLYHNGLENHVHTSMTSTLCRHCHPSLVERIEGGSQREHPRSALARGCKRSGLHGACAVHVTRSERREGTMKRLTTRDQ